ncbi:protein SLOW WALKER 1 [Telopea speciosissima]|uniref:protein SLOW WALKER 1 n=1 Tax=Telopea speciosissima TaxID=54955 RepID=UPI001CC377EF|nr:protein SLOW WALKER 1 [Telopea speciosissima]
MADDQLGKTFPVKSRLKPTPKKPSSSLESKYWRSFKTQQIPGLVSAITSIDFSPDPPHDFASTFSASVTLYNSRTLESKFKITSFSDVAYSATFRSDGKLLAAGGESGIVQVFDAKSKSDLHRKLRGHTRPVRLVRYPRFDKLHLFSGGDDSLVKYWDVASETELLSLQGHKDYVRSGFASPASSDMFATGSYDHTVRVWDIRVSSLNSVMEVNHGKPVEDVVFLPSGGLLATAGGNSVKIWDVMAGGKLVHTVESHNKTVTSLCVGKIGRDGGEESQKYRLFSVSLDGFLKVFDYSALKITHSMRYPAPLLSVGFSLDCSVRAIGTSNGILFVGKRKKEQTEIDAPGADKLFGIRSVEEPENRVLKPTNFRYFHRGQFEKPSEGDYLVKRLPKVKLAEHDKLLRKFRHKEALVSVLNGKNPQNVVAVMEELVARKKLLKCVSNLDMEELGLLLGFLQRYVTMPRFSGFLMSLTKKVVELRAEDVRTSDLLKDHVRNLKRSVEEEIRIQQSMQEIQGIVSPLMMIAGRR